MNDSPFMQLVRSFNQDTIWVVVKFLYLTGFFVYVVFAAVVIAQIYQMTAALRDRNAIPLRLLAWGHFLAAIAAFVLAFVIL